MEITPAQLSSCGECCRCSQASAELVDDLLDLSAGVGSVEIAPTQFNIRRRSRRSSKR
jgi:hypothetical protein